MADCLGISESNKAELIDSGSTRLEQSGYLSSESIDIFKQHSSSARNAELPGFGTPEWTGNNNEGNEKEVHPNTPAPEGKEATTQSEGSTEPQTEGPAPKEGRTQGTTDADTCPAGSAPLFVIFNSTETDSKNSSK